jgi:hypothetical protein
MTWLIDKVTAWFYTRLVLPAVERVLDEVLLDNQKTRDEVMRRLEEIDQRIALMVGRASREPRLFNADVRQAS